MRLRCLDLFAGIGGFSLAASWMNWETVAWVEINEFCQQVLKKNFPEAKGYGDIKQFDGTKYRGAIDIITGGFPCQPFSSAGKRKGTDDHRHLWPEMLRVIREVQPSYIVGENVFGIVNWSKGLVFEQVCTDLENEGYQVQPVILPACAVNAPHRRDRIWFVAYSHRNSESISAINDRQVFRRMGAITSNSDSDGHERQEPGKDQSAQTESEGQGLQWQRVRGDIKRTSAEGNVANTNNQGLSQRQVIPGMEGSTNGQPKRKGTAFFDGWPTQSPVCGRNDGVPNRADRIKALGNAIVPQVTYEIFKAIEAVNKSKEGVYLKQGK